MKPEQRAVVEARRCQDLWKDERRQSIDCNQLTHTHTLSHRQRTGCIPIVSLRSKTQKSGKEPDANFVLHVALRLVFDILTHLSCCRWLCLFWWMFSAVELRYGWVLYALRQRVQQNPSPQKPWGPKFILKTLFRPSILFQLSSYSDDFTTRWFFYGSFEFLSSCGWVDNDCILQFWANCAFKVWGVRLGRTGT